MEERTANLCAEEKNGSHFDAEYLDRLKDDDPTTWDHFDSYFRSRLTIKLRGRRLPPWLIQDVIQETFLQVLAAVRNNRVHTPAAFGGFVSAVCRNVASNRQDFQKNVDVTEIDIPDPAVNLEVSVLLLERKKQIELVLNGMRKKDRDLLYAKIYCGLTFKEISVLFGASAPDRLRLLLHRALKKFAKACKERSLDFYLG
jgi:RNA polymerase sigma factor (sigma-70 family)